MKEGPPLPVDSAALPRWPPTGASLPQAPWLVNELGVLADGRELPALLQGRRDSGGQWHLRDIQRHRHQAVVADGTDEIDDTAVAEGVLDALERPIRDAARRQQLRDEAV